MITQVIFGKAFPSHWRVEDVPLPSMFADNVSADEKRFGDSCISDQGVAEFHLNIG
jgi:hypothetical protein